ncbi:MAG TPA: hypothetical protein ENL07_06400 [Chlorobaculum parvum]|uniref:Uncharacterized protein n=1 Tax=Chlorobaculum parvum TaxID=274539 RepID=A0A7C5DGW9_9CHLB|nr:hypothetical protein [Chlorobaculum parvum]
MNERLTASLLVSISIALIVAELLVAAYGGFDPGWMVLLLSLYAGLVGLLFGVRTLSEGRREVVESVSERRARAKRDGLVGDLLDDYDVDEEFLGRGHGGRKPTAAKSSVASASAEAGEPVRDERSAMSLSIDKGSFDDYIKRCMSDPDTCTDEEANNSEGFSVGLDAGDLSAQPGTPPTEFSHDPKAVIERFKRSAGKR